MSLPTTRFFVRLSALLAGWLVAATAFAAPGEPPGRVGRVADVQGSVWMLDVEDGEWVAAQRNRPLTGGDRLSTDGDARAELNIGSAVLRLDGGTEIQLLELDDQRVRVQLDRGGLALRLRSNEVAREFEVVTPEGRFLPQRAGHVRIDRQGDTSFAGAWKGGLRFESNDSALDIDAGQRAEFWRDNSGPTQYTWSTVEQDGFADWVLAQDQRDRRNEREWAAREISPEMTGVDELDRYGSWDRHPEYGTVWTPAVVSPGWAPYRYGHWAWVRPWGWTWVDDAPWGFAPFHYGRWVNWRGNWCWTPGRYTHRPVYSPALVGWVGGPHISVGISVGGRPSLPPYVGWVPLGPRDHYRPGYRPHQPRHPEPVRTGPIMYSNQGVPGGVTVVPSQVMRERQPISGTVVSRVDPQIVRDVSRQPTTVAAAPPPPAARVVAVPGGARALVPGSQGAQAPGRVLSPAQPRFNNLDTPAARGYGGAQRGESPMPVPRTVAPVQAPRAVAPDQAPRPVAPAPQAVVPAARPPQAVVPARPLPVQRGRDSLGTARTAEPDLSQRPEDPRMRGGPPAGVQVQPRQQVEAVRPPPGATPGGRPQVVEAPRAAPERERIPEQRSNMRERQQVR